MSRPKYPEKRQPTPRRSPLRPLAAFTLFRPTLLSGAEPAQSGQTSRRLEPLLRCGYADVGELRPGRPDRVGAFACLAAAPPRRNLARQRPPEVAAIRH